MSESLLHEQLGELVRELMREKGIKVKNVAVDLSGNYGISEQATYCYLSSIRRESVPLHQKTGKVRVEMLLDYLGVPATDDMRLRVREYKL